MHGNFMERSSDEQVAMVESALEEALRDYVKSCRGMG